ncbi:MAG: transposase [Casimicrobium sp.]|jgi:putative transposase
MPKYLRYSPERRPIFVTVKTLTSQAILVEHRDALRNAIETVQARRPFTIDAMVLLTDHFHTIWTLPIEDEDFSSRISVIKTLFAKQIERDDEVVTSSRTARRERGIWQRRFYDHVIRDERDLQNHIDYIHINPVKHGYVQRVQDWPHSSFHRYVRQGLLPMDWAGGDATDFDAGE